VAAPVSIEAARLFDGRAVQTSASVLIESGSVVRVGGPAPEGVERIEFAGATILPGLIDAHVHLCFDASATPVEHLAERDDAAALEQMAAAAARALRAGITTVRDLGARGDLIFQLRTRIESGAVEGAHILAAGRPLTIPMGHCWFLGGVADDEAALLALVRTEVERGADVIKIMATGGAMTATSDVTRPQFAAETLRRAVDLAHELARPVAAHAHSRQGMREAVEAGVETIEHGTFVGPDGARVHDEDLSLLAGSYTVLVPTLSPIGGRAGTPEARAGALEPQLSAAEFWARRQTDVGRLYRAGVRMIVGSDCGVGHTPHDSAIGEIQFLASTGVAPAAALAAATADSAEVLGIGTVTGRLAPGLRADVLVVEGNPLEDLSALRRPVAVFKAGRRVVIS
jgi:imidazolonepropionase-like amidohydrolase